MMSDDLPHIAARYRRFADEEATGRSPLYQHLARRVADDEEILVFLASLPHAKQQANLLLAAVRHVLGAAAQWPKFRACVLEHTEAVRALMLSHATQTNEPDRTFS